MCDVFYSSFILLFYFDFAESKTKKCIRSNKLILANALANRCLYTFLTNKPRMLLHIYKMYDMHDKYMTCIYKILQNSEKVKNSCWNAGNRDSELHRTKFFWRSQIYEKQ